MLEKRLTFTCKWAQLKSMLDFKWVKYSYSPLLSCKKTEKDNRGLYLYFLKRILNTNDRDGIRIKTDLHHLNYSLNVCLLLHLFVCFKYMALFFYLFHLFNLCQCTHYFVFLIFHHSLAAAEKKITNGRMDIIRPTHICTFFSIILGVWLVSLL